MKVIRSPTAEAIAAGLLSFFCDAGSFPVVLRSDNAQEFHSRIVGELNRLLEVKHVTGSSYHPQSQGRVERMHRTLNKLVRALVDDDPEDWERHLQFAVLLLRTSPMAALGGRSPYEVVTGLKPRMPRSMTGAFPVAELTTEDYVKELLASHQHVRDILQKEALAEIEKDETTMGGRLKQELEVGDPVLVKREKDYEHVAAPTRFISKVYPGTYVVRTKLGPNSFNVEDLVDKDFVPPFRNPVNADRLIKLDMPELELDASQPRKVSVKESATGEFNTYLIDRFGVDGRVRVQLEDGAASTRRWLDLSKCEYRWLA